jgi:hypothetical protein
MTTTEENIRRNAQLDLVDALLLDCELWGGDSCVAIDYRRFLDQLRGIIDAGETIESHSDLKTLLANAPGVPE